MRLLFNYVLQKFPSCPYSNTWIVSFSRRYRYCKHFTQDGSNVGVCHCSVGRGKKSTFQQCINHTYHTSRASRHLCVVVNLSNHTMALHRCCLLFQTRVHPGGILIGTQWVRSPGVPCSLPLRLIEGTLLKVILFFQLPPLAKRAFVSACCINPPHQYVARDAANRTVGHTCSVRAAPTEL